MAWVKLDDAMPTHPKVMAAGPVAFALDVAGICYSNKHLTDGFIATYALPAVFPGMPNPRKVAAKLVEVGRWVECDGGWLIHDVNEYQPTAEHQKEISRKRAEAGRKGGSKSPTPPEAPGKQSAKQIASVPANPGPSRPVPEETNPSPEGNGEPFVKRLAQELRETHGCTLDRKDTRGDAYRDLLEQALEKLPPDRHHGTAMGVIADYVRDVQGYEMSREARSHAARLVRNHPPDVVFAAFGEALHWGAGVSAEYADDPLSLSKYVAGVLGKSKRGAA